MINRLLAAAENDRNGEGGHAINEVAGEQRMHEFGAALGDEIRAVLLPQTLHIGDVAEQH
jgi:hypothetical protein